MASHSKKPKSEEDSSPIYTLTQLHKLQTKEFFNFCIAREPPLWKLIYFFPSKSSKKYTTEWNPFFPHKRAPPTK